jgi:hypothetical protein
MSNQGSLFDDGPEGERRKDEGQKLVTAHQPDRWKAGVASVIAWLARCGTPFTGDDVRSLASLQHGEPEHPNAWGAQISAAAKRGDIEAVGYTTSKQPSRHGAVVRLWAKRIDK